MVSMYMCLSALISTRTNHLLTHLLEFALGLTAVRVKFHIRHTHVPLAATADTRDADTIAGWAMNVAQP